MEPGDVQHGEVDLGVVRPGDDPGRELRALPQHPVLRALGAVVRGEHSAAADPQPGGRPPVAVADVADQHRPLGLQHAVRPASVGLVGRRDRVGPVVDRVVVLGQQDVPRTTQGVEPDRFEGELQGLRGDPLA